MTSFKKIALSGLCALAVFSAVNASPANAYLVTDSTANQSGVSFSANASHTGFNTSGAITATFTYNGPLSLNDTAAQNGGSSGDLNSNFFVKANIANYSGMGSLSGPANADFSTLDTFLASSGSASGYKYGSFFTIDLGVLAAGTNLTITHDDGASVYQNGMREGITTDGPTVQVTEMVKLTSTYDTILYYARENGTPSILDVSVPEPVSMSVLGSGLIGLGLARRRRQAPVTTG
jgi:hypothetical protein